MPMIRRASAALTLLLITLLLGSNPALAQRTRYSNQVNQRFATISTGPQSALIVDVADSATDAEVRQAVSRRAKAEWNARSRSLAKALRDWEGAGLLKPDTMIPLSSLVQVRKGGRLVGETAGVTRGRQLGGGTLTFRYTGFDSQDDIFLLERFLARALPRIEAVYGKPARSGQVEIVNAGNLFSTQIPEVRRFAYGVYDASNNRILLPLFQNPRGTLQALLLNIIHAFHGPAVFQYDAWEQGFARAAAAVVLRDPIFNTEFGLDDPSANFLYSLLPYYEILNQAPLGNATFFPPSQTDIPIDGQLTVVKMLWARIGMSGAAWLKVYIENQSFFRQFNELYYSQFDTAAQPSLAGNIPALKAIAEGLLGGGVEGVPWQAWYARQFVLDTSVSPGNKLYAFVLPGVPDSEGRQSAAVTLVNYRTERSGDEVLLNGQAFGTYFDASNSRLNLGPQAERAVIQDGEGGLTVTTTNSAGTDATRLTMDFTAGNSVARTYIPVGYEGDFQGVLLLNNSARTVTITQTTLPPVSTRNQTGVPVAGASFGTALGSPIGDLSITTVTVSDGTNTRTWRINTGDGQYYAVLRDGSRGGGVVTVSKTFDSGTVPYLVTFPLQPLESNPATALGLNAGDFLLTYWDPLRFAYDTVASSQTPISPIQVGRGYWLKLAPQNLAAQVTVSITGIAPPTDTDLTIPCVFGWNLIGSPFDQPIEINRVLVKVLQNEPISWDSAVEQNLVAAQPFSFDRVTGEYRTVSGLLGDWTGYWIRVFAPTGVTLILPGPDSPTRAALVPTRKRSEDATESDTRKQRPDWSIRLHARQEGVRSTPTALLGAAPGASRAFDTRFDLEMPPPVLPTLSLAFAAPEGAKTTGGRIVNDFRDSHSAGRGRWQLQVSPPVSGPVTLSWDGLGSLPHRSSLTLVDKATGQQVSLRARSSYTFVAEAGISRAFELINQPGSSLPLQVTNLVTVPGRGLNSLITFSGNVTRSANISVEVSALNGRAVRRLSGTRSQESGVFRVTWDGRGQDGAPLPPGSYNVTVTAQTEEGERVQIRRVMALIR